jgi:hypothetical protein
VCDIIALSFHPSLYVSLPDPFVLVTIGLCIHLLFGSSINKTYLNSLIKDFEKYSFGMGAVFARVLA